LIRKLEEIEHHLQKVTQEIKQDPQFSLKSHSSPVKSMTKLSNHIERLILTAQMQNEKFYDYLTYSHFDNYEFGASIDSISQNFESPGKESGVLLEDLNYRNVNEEGTVPAKNTPISFKQNASYMNY
jgi:hypothetical protein